MGEAEAFDETTFLGLARAAKRDPYRLSLFAQHLDTDERPRVLLPVHGGTLIVTDRRLLEMRAHLEVHGAWNVKEFRGYAIHSEIDRASIQDLTHTVEDATASSGGRRVEDRLVLVTSSGRVDLLVSRGPEPTLSDGDFAALRDAVLGPQAK